MKIRIAEWGKVIYSHDARPATTRGASITPAQNSFGSWATVLAGGSVTDDVYAIRVFVHNINVSGSATDSLTNIGVDPAGGTSFTTLIPNLLTSDAGSEGNVGATGVSYYFPVKIKAGSTIGAQGSINRATLGTQRVQVILYCRPRDLELQRAGSYVRSFGEDTANSRGTAVTAGTTSEGTWTQVGSAISDPSLWFWQCAMAPLNDAAVNSGQIAVDMSVGASGGEKIIVHEQIVQTVTLEECDSNYSGYYGEGVNGDKVYARGQSGSATTAMSAIAYAVGG